MGILLYYFFDFPSSPFRVTSGRKMQALKITSCMELTYLASPEQATAEHKMSREWGKELT